MRGTTLELSTDTSAGLEVPMVTEREETPHNLSETAMKQATADISGDDDFTSDISTTLL